MNRAELFFKRSLKNKLSTFCRRSKNPKGLIL